MNQRDRDALMRLIPGKDDEKSCESIYKKIFLSYFLI